MSNLIKTVAGIADYAKSKKIAHLHTEGNQIKGNQIQINGKALVNFASCSYLGLEFHPKIKAAAKKCIDKYGTQFSSSRAYLSLGIYEELTLTLNQIFKGYTAVTPTTTLGHISAIPVLTSSDDLIVLDHQVHNSVQMAVQICKAKGTAVKLIRHNDLVGLEKMIIENRDKFDKIWYMADGIYSMYGDKAPIHELKKLSDKHAKLHLYIDDAHAMSCFGNRGQGYVLSEIEINEKLVVGTSLNKAFASGGGAIICGRKDWADLIMKCGGPMITSGPMQPSCLGAALQSAKLHLSGEIKPFQTKLKDNILYMHLLLEQFGLPNLSEKDSPIFFIGTSLPAVAYSIIEKMIEKGHYLNLGIFPAVPIKNTGVRFTITALHTFEQIEKMVKDLAVSFNLSLSEEKVELNQIYAAFKMQKPEEKFFHEKVTPLLSPKQLYLETFDSLTPDLSLEWDKYLGKKGLLTAENLKRFQTIHRDHKAEENNWEMKFIFIRNEAGEIILSTFFTACLLKDDMLSSAELSKEIEKMRCKSPLYMTHKAVMIGCPLTEGNQIFVEPKSSLKKSAFKLLFDALEKFQEDVNASSTMIRDMNSDDAEFDYFMVDNGYFKINLPESYSFNHSTLTIDEFKSGLSKRNRRHFKENIEKTAPLVEMKIADKNSSTTDWKRLYSNVFGQNKEINTFKINAAFFEHIKESNDWETLELYAQNTKQFLGMVICHKGHHSYTPLLVGLDYDLNGTYNTYRNLIWSVIKRSKKLNLGQINFGFSAGIEKRKFGAQPTQYCVYMQCKDNYNQEVLLNESINKSKLAHAN